MEARYAGVQNRYKLSGNYLQNFSLFYIVSTKTLDMLGNSLRSSLSLLVVLLTFTQCSVIKDLTTERNRVTIITKPKLPTHREPPKTSSGSRKPVAEKDMVLRHDIVDYAKDQLGARYKYAGRTPKGFDCSGFTHYVMDNFDLRLSPSSRAQENEGKKIKVEQAKPGDLIFFRRSRAGAVFHVALVVSNDRKGLTVIHSTSRGVVVDNITNSKYWKPKISTARDVVGR